ncbi:MAG: glycosyltransferase family 39 protein, partial [Planctomycetes bacterium]|nr:glycosyltransferase family 39 protein [Planctomycetota bacterium]
MPSASSPIAAGAPSSDGATPGLGGWDWRWVLVAYVLVGVAFHAMHIDSSVGFDEMNLGEYFGPSVQTWNRFGFFELRGIPFWLHYPRSPETGFQYLNHPPGVFWIMNAFGTSELALRLPGAIASIVGALGMFDVMRRRMPDPFAALAGATMIVCTGYGVLSIGSYETMVVCAGLWLWSLAERAQADGAWRWRVAAAVLAFLGPVLDWQFGFWGFGLVWLLDWRRPRRWLLLLTICGAATVAGAGLVLLWRSWALQAPFVNAPSDVAIGSIFESATEARPGFAHWLGQAITLLAFVVGPAVAWLACAGLPWLVWRHPKLAAALVVAGIGPVATFAHHALDHAIFYTLATPLVVASSAFGLVALARVVGVRIAMSIGILVLGATWWSSHRHVSASRTDLPREVAHQLVERSKDGCVTLSDFEYVFLYYVDSPTVFTMPLSAPDVVDAIRSSVDATRGVWFLWWKAKPDSPLGRYLAGFESEPARFDAPLSSGAREGG